MEKFENYRSNLAVLSKAEQEDLTNSFIISGIIDKFSLQFELAWKVLKELLRYEGSSAAASGSPREILNAAYGVFEFLEESVWLSMLHDRIDMAHIYDEAAAERTVGRILQDYIPAFLSLQAAVETRYGTIMDTL